MLCLISFKYSGTPVKSKAGKALHREDYAVESILHFTRHSWPLSTKGSLAYHTYCDMGHPFLMVIAEDPWNSHVSRRRLELPTISIQGKCSNCAITAAEYMCMCWVSTLLSLICFVRKTLLKVSSIPIHVHVLRALRMFHVLMCHFSAWSN